MLPVQRELSLLARSESSAASPEMTVGGVVVRHALPRTAMTSLPAQNMREQRDHEQDDEKEEQQFSDACSGHGDPCETEGRCEQSDDEEAQCIAQHRAYFTI